jgi:hypothetical protein
MVDDGAVLKVEIAVASAGAVPFCSWLWHSNLFQASLCTVHNIKHESKQCIYVCIVISHNCSCLRCESLASLYPKELTSMHWKRARISAAIIKCIIIA